jgi:hypothetical protein
MPYAKCAASFVFSQLVHFQTFTHVGHHTADSFGSAFVVSHLWHKHFRKPQNNANNRFAK